MNDFFDMMENEARDSIHKTFFVFSLIQINESQDRKLYSTDIIVCTLSRSIFRNTYDTGSEID